MVSKTFGRLDVNSYFFVDYGILKVSEKNSHISGDAS